MTSSNRRNWWRPTVIVLAMALVVVPACKKKTGSSKEGTRTEAPKPPPELLTYLALRAPAGTVDRTIGLVRNFVPLMLDRNTVVGFALQATGLPPTLVQALDLTRTGWFLALDAEMLAEPDPSLLALPIRSAAALEKVLSVHLQPLKKDTKGSLRHWRPKPGNANLAALMLSVQDGYALIPSSEKVLAKVGPYLRKALLSHRPGHDLELHVVHREDARTEKGLRRTLDQLTRRLKRQGTDALQQSLTDALVRYTKLLWTAEHLTITADITAQGPVLGLTARGGGSGGELAQLIKRERTGPPLGAELLPAASWLVLARHGSPPQRGPAAGGLLATILDGFTQEMAPQARDRFRKAAKQLGKSLGESSTFALHRPAEQSGLGVLYVAQVVSKAGVEQSMQQFTGLLGEAIGREQNKAVKGEPKPADLKTRPLRLHGASGAVSRIAMPDSLVGDPRFSLPRVIGPDLTLAWALRGGLALFAAGKGAEAQLKHAIRILAGETAKERFVGSKRFRSAVGDSSTRNGLLYLSLVDLVRSIAGLGYAEADMLAASLAKADVQTAVSINWGVDRQRGAYQVSASVPIAHLLHFRPLLQGLGAGSPF